jgi:hypothetical protein
MIVTYDDLMQSPESVFRSIYSRFGYSESEALETLLRDAATEVRAHSSSHRYSYETMGFSREQIVREFAHIFARFGFDQHEPVEKQLVESSSI